MTVDDRLEALLAADRPPARDPAFSLVVAERLARRRAWTTLLALTPWLILVSVAAWAVHPALEAWAVAAAPLSSAGGLLMMTLALLWAVLRLIQSLPPAAPARR